jgi:two-component system NtrC family response regulator
MDDPIRVMVVDDEKDFLYTMEYWLKSKGYQVVTAANGLEAIEVIKKEALDIIFLDLHMPVMDGLDALKNIRQLNKDIPIILITAYASDEKVTEAEKYGISGLFYKYKDLSESTSLIETILRRHKDLKQEQG